MNLIDILSSTEPNIIYEFLRLFKERNLSLDFGQQTISLVL